MKVFGIVFCTPSNLKYLLVITYKGNYYMNCDYIENPINK